MVVRDDRHMDARLPAHATAEIDSIPCGRCQSISCNLEPFANTYEFCRGNGFDSVNLEELSRKPKKGAYATWT